MEQIERMEAILNDYEDKQKQKEELDAAQKNAERVLEKEKERYEEAQQEFGPHSMNDYEYGVLREFEGNIEQHNGKVEEIKKSIEDVDKAVEAIFENEGNIAIFTQGIAELDKEIKAKELKLRKIDLELTEYYSLSDEERKGKYPQDFYNEQDSIKNELSDLKNKREKCEQFLVRIKDTVDKKYSKIAEAVNERYGKEGVKTYSEWNEEKPEPGPQPEPKPGPQPEPEPGPQPEPKPGPQPEPKPGPQPEPKAGPQPEPKPGPQPEPKPGPQPEPKPGPQPEPKPGPQPEPKPRPQQAKLTSILCTVKEGSLTYVISFKNEKGEEQQFELNEIHPQKMNKQEKKDLKRMIDTKYFSGVDIEIASALSRNDIVKDSDLYGQYINYVKYMMDGLDKLPEDIKVTYDLESLRDTDLSRKEKRYIKRLAKNSEAYGIADYVKPKSRFKAFWERITQGKLEEGKPVPSQDRDEDDDRMRNTTEIRIMKLYDELSREEGFDVEQFIEQQKQVYGDNFTAEMETKIKQENENIKGNGKDDIRKRVRVNLDRSPKTGRESSESEEVKEPSKPQTGREPGED